MSRPIFGDQSLAPNNDLVVYFSQYLSDSELVNFALICRHIYELLLPIIDDRARIAVSTIKILKSNSGRIVDVPLRTPRLLQYVNEVYFDRLAAASYFAWKNKLLATTTFKREYACHRRFTWEPDRRPANSHEMGDHLGGFSQMMLISNVEALLLFLRLCPNLVVLRYHGYLLSTDTFLDPALHCLLCDCRVVDYVVAQETLPLPRLKRICLDLVHESDVDELQFLFLMSSLDAIEIEIHNLCVWDQHNILVMLHCIPLGTTRPRRIVLHECRLTRIALKLLLRLFPHCDSMTFSGTPRYWSIQEEWYHLLQNDLMIESDSDHTLIELDFTESDLHDEQLTLGQELRPATRAIIGGALHTWRDAICHIEHLQDFTVKLSVENPANDTDPDKKVWTITVARKTSASSL